MLYTVSKILVEGVVPHGRGEPPSLRQDPVGSPTPSFPHFLWANEKPVTCNNTNCT